MDRTPETPSKGSPPATDPYTHSMQSPTPPELVPSAKKEKGRVRFNSTTASEPPKLDLPGLSSLAGNDAPAAPRLRPSVLRGNSYNSVTSQVESDEDGDPDSEKAMSAFAAQERAQHVAATLLGSHSAPGSRRNSLDSEAETVNSNGQLLTDHSGIPLDDLHLKPPETLDGNNDEDMQRTASEQQRKLKRKAYYLVRSHTQRQSAMALQPPSSTTVSSGQRTPMEEIHTEHYVPPPAQYRGGVLSSLLTLYKPAEGAQPSGPQHNRRSLYGTSGFTTPGSSGTATPNRKKWYDKNRSQDTLANLVEASARLGSLANGTPSGGSPTTEKKPKRPKHKRGASGKIMSFGRPQMDEEIRITMHIAETLSRQKYIIKMCKALMLFGAPTHRLEEYLRMTARVLEIDGQFLYLPGCMIISFDDKSTHTTEVKIVRTSQGIDLGKLKDVHEIYKSVLHDLYGVDEAIEKLSQIIDQKDKFHPWLRVLVFGLASAMVAPFGFQGRLIDLPVCFLLGSMVGFLQIIAAPKSEVYNNVFEITAVVLTSFLSRAFGSINGGKLFCFSALAQSSIALILPGWLVLCSALELQSRALVPGSIRMVYAIIYSLVLGFGITLGTTLYGLADRNASSDTTCQKPMNQYWAFCFVPAFTICLAFVNQAKWKQMPVMIMIAFAGYIVNFFSGLSFSASPQIANTLGAFTVGVLANLYSRIRHGVAVTALLPAIFVQVPSGLAATGSLLSGLNTANQLNNATQPVNGTVSSQIYSNADGTNSLQSVTFNVAASMIQIAIGITLGLFLSALIVYPFGKRRSGLWTL